MKNIYSLWGSMLLSFMLFPAVALSFTAEEVEQMADIGLRVNLEGTAMVEVKPDDDPSRIKQTRLLDLSSNRLMADYLPELFTALQNMLELDVSHNEISSFQAGGKIESLEKLVLSSNSLSKIGFIDMPNLLKWQMLDNDGRISLAEDYDDPFTMTNLVVFDCKGCPEVLSEAFRKKQKRAEEKYNKEKLKKRKAEFQGKCLHKTAPYGQQYRDETGMEFMWVPCGCFMMGDTFKEGDNDEQLEHVVCLQGFYLGKYEVTQAQWQGIMGKNPSEFQKGDDYPVENVSWNDVQEFIGKLNRQSGKEYSLPSEAHWEYAASWRPDGSKARFGNGKDIADPAEINFDGSAGGKKSYSKAGVYRQKTVPMDSFLPNALGLYNMSGNVWEWCQDRWHDDYKDAPDDGSVWESGDSSLRVIRGGSWFSRPWGLRAAFRDRLRADNCDYIVGFRLLLPVQ